MPTREKKPKVDVREACLAEALRIISREGVEALSLRDVARRLEISHQAPYKHFPSRDHIVAEIMRRAFVTFTNYLRASIAGVEPPEELRSLGRAYMEYALKNPLEYRLMFGTPLPNLEAHPALAESTMETFSILKDTIRAAKPQSSDEDVKLDALFAWSAVHGLAGITQAGSFSALGIDTDTEVAMAIVRVMDHICQSVNGQG